MSNNLQNPEIPLIETGSDNNKIDQIKTSLAEIKSSVEDVNKKIEDLDKNKKTLNEQEIAGKQKEIDEKKLEIDKKKKETEELIKQARALADLEQDIAVTVSIRHELDKYEKELNNINPKSSGFREKVKNGANKTWEWAKENPKTAIAATAGIGLLVRGISRLFRKKRKNVEGGDDKKEKKGFRDRRYGKALKRGLIGTGAAWLLRGVFGGNRNFFNVGKDTNNPNKPVGPETIPGAPGAAEQAKECFENKNPEIKQAYNEIALNINNFYSKPYGEGNENGTSEDDMFGESDFEKNGTESLPGTVLFMLDNRYATVADMLNEKAFVGEIVGADVNSALDRLKKLSADKIKEFLLPIASKFDASTRGLINAAGKTEDIVNAIKGKPDAEKIIAMVFRKSMKVFAYMQNRKTALVRELVKSKLKTDNKEGFNDKKPEDQEKAIDLCLEDQKFYDDYIKSDLTKLFMSQKIVDFKDGVLIDCAYKVLKEKNLIEAKLEQDNQEDIDELDKEKSELLGKEEDGSDKLSDLKEKIKDGKLEAQDQKTLEEFCENFVEIMETSGKNTYLNKYFFLLEIFNTEADTGEKIYESSEYKVFVEETKKTVEEILKKSKEGTLTENDIDNLRSDVDDYYIIQKELTIATYEVHQSRDSDNNNVVDIIFARSALVLRKGIMNFKEGIQLVWSGDGLVEKSKGGAIIAGNLVGVYLIRHPLKGVKKVVQLGKWTAVKGFNIAEQLTGKTLRNKLPRGRGARWYNEKTLNYAVGRGEISLENAMQVAKKKERKVGTGPNARRIKTQEELLEFLFPGRTDYIKLKGLLNKYKNNKYVMRELIGMKYDGKWTRPKDWFKLDKTRMTFEINNEVLTKLQNIEVRIAGFKTETERTIFQSMMKHVRSIDQAQDLATMSIDAKYLKLFESGSEQIISAEKFGRYLGRYGKKLNPEQMGKFMEFFQNAKTANKLTATNKEVIVLNAFKNFNKLEAKGFNISIIDELKLNVSRYEIVSTRVKAGVGNMIKDLKGFLKNPKMKTFEKGIEAKINTLTQYEKTITPESIKATEDMVWLDKVTGFGKLSPEGIKALSSLNILLKTEKGADILKALQGAKKLEDVKDILSKAGIDASKIDDGILLKIAQTKNANKIKSIVNYGSEIQSISTLKKVFSNPTMRAFGKWLGFVGVAVDFLFVGMEANTQFAQAEDYKKYNVARGENMESKAYFDVVTGGLAATAGLLATIGFVNAWNPVGWVSLGVAGVLTGAKEMGDLYYGEIDKFKQSYQDFLKKDLPAIKQDLIYVNNWQTGLDASFRDKMAILKYIPTNPANYILGSIGESSIIEKAKSGTGTATDAIHAIIYMEEMQKYPYAMGDLNSDEVRKNPELKALVEQQKELHSKSVEERFSYTKKTYIDGKSNIVPKERLEKAEGIQALDEILKESRIYQTMQLDGLYTNKTDVKGYKKFSEDLLKKENMDAFTKLENVYKINPNQFYEIVAGLPYYESMFNEYKIGDTDYTKISQNLDFLKKYITYKTLGMSVSDLPVINFDPQKIDYNEINSLLLTFGTTVTGITAGEISNENVEYLDDGEVNEKYDVSTNLGQNVLYEIAKSKYLNYVGPNDFTSLKTFYSEDTKDSHGIYYDIKSKEWRINEDYGIDNSFGDDEQLNNVKTIQHMREHINDALSSSTTGKMIPAAGKLNQEYARSFLQIIDRELIYRTHAYHYKQEAINYIKANSNGKYIELNADIIKSGTKSGIKNIAAFVYSRDGKKLDAKTTKKDIESELIK